MRAAFRRTAPLLLLPLALGACGGGQQQDRQEDGTIPNGTSLEPAQPQQSTGGVIPTGGATDSAGQQALPAGAPGTSTAADTIGRDSAGAPR